MKTTHQLENVRELSELLNAARIKGDTRPYIGGGYLTYNLKEGSARYFTQTNDAAYEWMGTVEEALKEFAPLNVSVAFET